jgi:UDP-arabinose 4-epimerase
MRNVLVTGGAGYIGSHTCKELAKQGYQPIVYDNLVYGHEWAVKWGPFIRGDLRDRDLLIRTMRGYQIEAVLHFAAFAYVGESVMKPEVYYENNVGGSLSLLNAMKEAGVNRIVFSSTCATYGNPITVPISESHPQNPINPYGKTKLVVEGILHDFKQAHQIQSVSLRYFNAAGADLDGEIGEVHQPETHLIPLALDAALGHRESLTVFGTDYPTPDGSCIRDYIHVTDLAQAHILALNGLESNRFSPFYNLGNGKGFSVKEVIQSVEKVTGKKVPVNYGDRRAGDPPTLIANSLKIQEELGWKPQFTKLDEILETAYRFSRKKSPSL